jgi:hypothetical protein
VDKDGRLAGKVDDLEFAWAEGTSPYVAAILIGPSALSARLNGRLGRLVRAVAKQSHESDDPEPARISFGVVESIGTEVTLSVATSEIPVAALPKWVGEHVIGKIPGADRAPE